MILGFTNMELVIASILLVLALLVGVLLKKTKIRDNYQKLADLNQKTDKLKYMNKVEEMLLKQKQRQLNNYYQNLFVSIEQKITKLERDFNDLQIIVNNLLKEKKR